MDKFSNATAVLLRVFIELSVTHFIKEKFPKQNDKNLNLFKKLQIASDYMEGNNILTKDELKPIRTATSKKDIHDESSTHTLNSYVHNPNHNPITTELRSAWNNYKKFIEKLWE